MKLTTTRQYLGYLLMLAIVAAAGLLVILVINLIADPFNIYRLVGGEKFAKYKGGIATRIGKSEGIYRQPWDVILLGNSRVEVGFDPEHPAWNNQRIFNAGLPGAKFDELSAACGLALHNPSVKRLVLCIDWTSFDSDPAPNPDSSRSLLNPDVNLIDYHIGNLLSLYTLDRSIRTIRSFASKSPSPFTPRGFSLNELVTHGRADWTLVNFHDFANPDRARNAPPPTLSARRLQSLDQLLAQTSARKIRVDLINPPIHVIHFERLALANKLSLHEQWLREITKIAANRAIFRDFGSYSLFTTEQIPAADGIATHMRWYWDPDHFKKELGDLIIDRITDHPAPDGIDISDFGKILAPENIEDHIARLHRDREDYIAARPDVREMRRESQTPSH